MAKSGERETEGKRRMNLMVGSVDEAARYDGVNKSSSLPSLAPDYLPVCKGCMFDTSVRVCALKPEDSTCYPE